MSKSRISASLTAEEKSAIKQKLNEIKSALSFIVSLTSKERGRLVKMGAKSVQFVQLALKVAQEHPEIIPGNFSIDEFAKDVALSSDLMEIELVSTPLANAISDTLMLVGCDAMEQANRVYELVKSSAKSDPALNEAKKQLAERYKAQGKKKGGQ
jgi:hypothetical protein